MERIIKKLKSRKGSMFPYTIAIILAMFFIFTATTEYFRLKNIVSEMDKTLQNAIINANIANFDNVYSANREGYASASEFDIRTITEKNIHAYAGDTGSGIDRIVFPDGNYVKSSKGTYTAKENGTYTFKVYDKAGNVRESLILVDEIDTEFIWLENVNIISIYNEINKLINLKKEGDHYVREIEGSIEYVISNLNINVINPPIKSTSNKKFIVESSMDVNIPLSFGWNNVPPLKINLKVNSEYMALF